MLDNLKNDSYYEPAPEQKPVEHTLCNQCGGAHRPQNEFECDVCHQSYCLRCRASQEPWVVCNECLEKMVNRFFELEMERFKEDKYNDGQEKLAEDNNENQSTPNL